MVFIIQNTQNRDAKATHIKLDELLKAIHGARNSLVSAEELSEKELDHLLAEFHEIHKKYEREITKKGGKISLS
jgi:low affinity Fe/Cu permease